MRQRQQANREHSRRRQLIVDTDPGVDDAFAIALAASHPGVDLLAVTTVFGNVALELTTNNALGLLALCGREDVPVGRGAARPLVHAQPYEARAVHGVDGLSGRAGDLPRRATGVDSRGAVALLADTLAAASEPVTLVPIGPLTNIALLLAVHPWCAERIDRVVIMGGGLAGGNTTAAAEFNVWSDPEAARRVLTEPGLRCVLVGLDVTLRCTVDTPWLDGLAATGPVGAALAALTPDYLVNYRATLGRDAMAIHDAVAVAEALSPGTVGTTALPVDVDCTFGPGRGGLLADRRAFARAEHTVEVGTEPKPDEVRSMLSEHLGAARPAPLA